MKYRLLREVGKRTEIVTAIGNWLSTFPWRWFATFTFQKDISPFVAEKRFIRFMSSLDKNAIYFYVIEPHDFRYCPHIHCLIGGANRIKRKAISKQWAKKYGISKILSYKKSKNAKYYLCKYIPEGKVEWNFELGGSDVR
jgi:hypothetical protein